jgi:hypothetical protein
MAAIDKAALALTQCWKCLGCERLEDESFRGDNTCQNYRKADAVTLIQRRGGEDTEPERQETIWRQK